ncbi:MAG: hypothetical protein U0840_15175 [Gemmataceae bacterium]
MSQAAPLPASGSPIQVFRDPESFIGRWHRGGAPYSLGVFLFLALVAMAGTAAYGAMMGLFGTAKGDVSYAAGANTLAAAIAWLVPLPAVYILNSMTGMRLRASTTFLAALVTAAWGGLAFLAFLPIALVYLLTFPGNKAVALFAHLVVFCLVGFSMAYIFGRQIEHLEPRRGGGRVWWLWIFVLLEVQLLYTFGLVTFEV